MALDVKGGANGILSGATTGASIGSIIPGLGTTLGGVIGGGLGLIGGLFKGDDELKEKQLELCRVEFSSSGERDKRRRKATSALRDAHREEYEELLEQLGTDGTT